MKTKVGKAEKVNKEYTIDEVLKNAGVYAWSDNKNVRVITCNSVTLFLNLKLNEIELFNVKAWDGRKLTKVDEIVTITFGE